MKFSTFVKRAAKQTLSSLDDALYSQEEVKFVSTAKGARGITRKVILSSFDQSSYQKFFNSSNSEDLILTIRGQAIPSNLASDWTIRARDARWSIIDFKSEVMMSLLHIHLRKIS